MLESLLLSGRVSLMQGLGAKSKNTGQEASQAVCACMRGCMRIPTIHVLYNGRHDQTSTVAKRLCVMCV